MNRRARNFVGVILTFGWLVIYALVMMAVGAIVFGAQRPGYAHLLFYVIAGVGWLPVAMLIIRWMAKPDGPRDG